jgi:tRNA(Ile)-lysidine synthase
VERFAKKLRIKLEYKKIKLRSRAKGKRSLEEIAREKRYAFLKKAALKNGCSAIATGHTLDDQAETVLMRVITGAALEGLAGIPPVRSEDDIRFIRPLIRTTKKDILSFVKRNGIEYAQDRTNKDIRIKRNRIRIEVLPFLEKLNPRIRRSLANLSDVVRDDLLAMKSGEGSKLRRHPGQKKGLVELMITDLMLQPRALRKAIFKEAVKMTGGNIKKLTHRHWMEMDLLLRTGEKGKSLDLPGNIRATKSADRIEFNKK